MSFRTAVVAAAFVLAAGAACAQHRGPQPAGSPEQRAAIDALSMMDGRWVGPAVTTGPGGQKIEMTQTERVGSLLGGSVKVVEGRGYDASGATVFNAFAVISYDPAAGAYTMRAYSEGRKGDYPLTARADGFSWEMPAGPNTIRYTATVKDGTWREIGEFVAPGQPPRQFFEMNLKRVGDSDWPTGGAVDPKAR
ncbi:MAG TPA: DUF1579 domain-containing protein [Caulobacteraceae bacterium]|nr:DUF1579 domain-containing protein [Caulobacteraceae bacterium]